MPLKATEPDPGRTIKFTPSEMRATDAPTTPCSVSLLPFFTLPAVGSPSTKTLVPAASAEPVRKWACADVLLKTKTPPSDSEAVGIFTSAALPPAMVYAPGSDAVFVVTSATAAETVGVCWRTTPSPDLI